MAAESLSESPAADDRLTVQILLRGDADMEWVLVDLEAMDFVLIGATPDTIVGHLPAESYGALNSVDGVKAYGRSIVSGPPGHLSFALAPDQP